MPDKRYRDYDMDFEEPYYGKASVNGAGAEPKYSGPKDYKVGDGNSMDSYGDKFEKEPSWSESDSKDSGLNLRRKI